MVSADSRGRFERLFKGLFPFKVRSLVPIIGVLKYGGFIFSPLLTKTTLSAI